MLVETIAQLWRKARPSANSTDATFPSLVPTLTEPTGDGVITLKTDDGQFIQNGILVVPYATAADEDTYSVRVTGWRKLANATGTPIWVPVLLVEYACTTGTSAGVAGGQVVATELFADTLTLTTGNPGVSEDHVSPTGNTIAHFVADVKGFTKVQVTFQLGTTPTDMNALVSFL